MMRSVAIRALLLLLAAVPAAALHAAEAERVVTLAGDPWPPYIVGAFGKDATGGIGVDVMHAIFDRLEGAQLSVPLIPWKRALREVERGTKDGIGILLKTPEREAYMDYTDEVFRAHIAVWYSAHRFADGFDWQHYADFKPYRIGITRGHSYGDGFDRLVADGTLTVIEVASSRQLFAMLNKGRIDLVLANQRVGESHVHSLSRAGRHIVATDKPVSDEIYYIAFSKKSEARHLIPELNRVVAELRDEGVIERLVAAGTQQ